MKSFTLLLLLWAASHPSLLHGQTTSAGERETVTPEKYGNLEKNSIPLELVRLKGIIGALHAHQNTHDGKWPESWQQVEAEFGAGMWESPQFREQVLKTYVLLPTIDGQMGLQTPYPYKFTLMMVMATPMERKVTSDRVESGRWLIFKNESTGGPGIDWLSEKELQSFSAWPQVQSAIDRHLKTLPVTQPRLNTPQNTAPNQPIAKPHSEPAPKSSQTSEAVDAPKGPWFAWTAIMFAAIGLLWLLLKKRK